MGDPIVFVDTSDIREGRLEELRRAVAELAAFVDANETETISYQVFFGDGERQMTVLQIHADSASMERHMEIAGPVFAKFADLLVVRTIDIYGSPSAKVVEQLRRKADLLARHRSPSTTDKPDSPASSPRRSGKGPSSARRGSRRPRWSGGRRASAASRPASP